jgi:GH24 family phage-related lysozyme (muramidase)
LLLTGCSVQHPNDRAEPEEIPKVEPPQRPSVTPGPSGTPRPEVTPEQVYAKSISVKGLDMIKNFEMSDGVLRSWGIGEFDVQGNLLGILPHYVFKRNSLGQWISDGGITLGYGIWVSQRMYNEDTRMRALIDKYAPGASFTPPHIPYNGVTYVVPNSTHMPLEECVELLAERVETVFEKSLNNFLNTNQIELKQHQYDAILSFTYQYGQNWLTLQPEKEMTKFLKRGDFSPEEVMRVFLLHDDKERREEEALIFINGY